MLKDGNGYATEESSNEFSEGEYINHLKEGEWKGNFSKKKYSFVEKFDKGKLISGITTDSLGTQTPYDSTTFEVQPEYPSGIKSLMQFVGQTYDYPAELISKNINGTIKLGFIIEKDGSASGLKVINDLGYGSGAAGIKVLRKMKKWKPGLQRGVPVRVSYILPIRLNIL